MISTIQERERFVSDLYYNQGKNTREIAQEARMSFSAIGAILKKATEENETSKEQTEMMSQAAKAYKFFSDGKSYYANTCEYDIHEVCHLSSTL